MTTQPRHTTSPDGQWPPMGHQPPSPMTFPPGPPPPAQRKGGNWKWWAAIVVALFVGVGIGMAPSSSDKTTADPGPRPVVTVTVPADYSKMSNDELGETIDAVSAEVDARGGKVEEDAAPATEKPAVAASFGDGTYLVGADIKPGTYKTDGEGDGGGCYWARLANTSGDMDSINANDNISGQTTVTIKKSDKAFEASGGCTWVKR